ncbi:MAG: hypothetical protein LLG37_01400 [Spirochaetia bacterium]|nr:hypothetical protein [Spirochaetia bacterium]
MAPFKIHGPFHMDRAVIIEKIKRKAPGAFMLGSMNSSGEFVPELLGRSERDVREMIMDNLGKNYKCFKYIFSTTPKGAYEKECILFHTYFQGLHPYNHPLRPSSLEVRCPCCREMQMVE